MRQESKQEASVHIWVFPGPELLASRPLPFLPQGYAATKTRQVMFLGECTYSRGTPQTLHIQISWWAKPTSGRQILSFEIFLLSVRSQARLALDTEPSCLADPSSPSLSKLFSVPLLLGLQCGRGPPALLGSHCCSSFPASSLPTWKGLGAGFPQPHSWPGVSRWRFLCHCPQGTTPENRKQRCQFSVLRQQQA